MKLLVDPWYNSIGLSRISFECGYCGAVSAGHEGYKTVNQKANIYICGFCNQPTYIVGSMQVPAPVLGTSVENVPEPLNDLYEEARKCTSLGAYTACVMCCRKLLMNIAVEEGAKAGGSFAGYVKYLESNHYIPPKSKDWVDVVRELGNEANHQISPKTEDDALNALTFTEMMLRYLYQYPNQVAGSP